MRVIDANALKVLIDDSWHPDMMVSDIWQVIDQAPTVGGWISVEDRLPEENGEYLISTKDRVTSAYYEFGRRTSEWTDYFEGYLDFEPTHWMALPELPKEDANARD